MLKNIKIERFGSYKSFEGFDQNDFFKKMNILYGANYSGKTTLSKIIAILEKKKIPNNYSDPEVKLFFSDNEINLNNYQASNKKVIVFNKDFVDENLSFLNFNDYEEGSIKSFDAVIIGEDHIEVNRRIEELNESYNNINRTKDGLVYVSNLINREKDELLNKVKGIEESIDKELTKKAKHFESMGLTKTRYYNRQNLRSDINCVISDNPELTRKLSDEDIEVKKKDMKVTQKPFINLENKTEIITSSIVSFINKASEKLEDKVEKKISKELEEFFKKWVLDGYNLHVIHGKDECQFCGGIIQKDKMNEYKDFLNQKEEIIKNDIDSLIIDHKNIVTALHKNLENLPDPELYFYDGFINQYVTSRDKLKSSVLDFLEEFEFLKQQLGIKKSYLDEKIFYSLDIINSLLDELILNYAVIVNICSDNDAFSRNIEIEQNKIRTEIHVELVVQFLIEFQWYKYFDNIAEINNQISCLNEPTANNDDMLSQIENMFFSISLEIDSLMSRISNQLAASGLINKFLNNFFGHESLSLHPLVAGVDRFKIMRGSEDAFNLSEGECTLVAFCYFIAIVYNLNQNNELKDYLIYIDDPISSLDSNNIFYIFSLIENIICKDENYKQFFISTHNLEFLKYLMKLTLPMEKVKACNFQGCGSTKKNKKENVGYYFIHKKNSISQIGLMPNYLKNFTTEFNFLFSEIWKCSEVEQDVNPDQIYVIGNNMRKFMETYTYFKYPSNNSKNEYRKKFFIERDGFNYVALIDRIMHEYSHTEDFFDRVMNPITSAEIKKAAKFIISRLEEVDKDQFEGLLNSTRDLRENLT
ncbi:AAA family ATPase [Acinetobacter modestus]|uniref:AAA family ATPase n=1 Tax=Acinetobacter modestus TaxID=1776740 RepID=UPI001F4B9776|nr:AAA family ATPase [Acinetobacter modestus]MCH7329633.1 AAA family ATPase [Acinetobacter modestus]